MTDADNKSLAIRPSVLPSQQEWETQKSIARGLYESGMLGRHIQNPWAALAIIEHGREIGVSPMFALAHINFIDGKPSADAQILAGLIYQAHGDNALELVEETDDSVTFAYKRRGWAKPRQTSFTMVDARAAGLTNKQNWQKYPKAMLTARCISKIAHMAFQDVVAGLYTAEELAPDRVVAQPDGSMTIIDVPSTASTPPNGSGRPTPTPVDDMQDSADQAVDDSPRDAIEGDFTPVSDTVEPVPEESFPADYDEGDKIQVRGQMEERCLQLAAYAERIGHEQAEAIGKVPVRRLAYEKLVEWYDKLNLTFATDAAAD